MIIHTKEAGTGLHKLNIQQKIGVISGKVNNS